jgi:predicted transcriptional regulator
MSNGLQTREGLYGFEFLERDKRRTDDRRTYEIKQMWQRSHEIVNLALLGYKNTDIAEILNISPWTVSNTINCELGSKVLSEKRKLRDGEFNKVGEKIRVLTNKALKVYHEIFDDESGELGLKDKGQFAQEFVKEISGLRAPTRIQSHSINTTLTKEEIEEFKQRGMNAINVGGNYGKEEGETEEGQENSINYSSGKEEET